MEARKSTAWNADAHGDLIGREAEDVVGRLQPLRQREVGGHPDLPLQDLGDRRVVKPEGGGVIGATEELEHLQHEGAAPVAHAAAFRVVGRGVVDLLGKHAGITAASFLVRSPGCHLGALGVGPQRDVRHVPLAVTARPGTG